jgi:hypothetical protein
VSDVALDRPVWEEQPRGASADAPQDDAAVGFAGRRLAISSTLDASAEAENAAGVDSQS